MKKKQLNRKLTLTKQTLSLLDAQAMNAVRGGKSEPTELPKETERTYGCV